ncbi:hypothetical protein AGMMS50229_12200 [Campylobacterota bacterium]|nr:hypothetical protein AGMMS50229_12200 [Campylobacterota bacterium]
MIFYHTEYTPSEINRLLEAGKRRGSAPINPHEIQSAALSGKTPEDVIGGLNNAEQKLMEIVPNIYFFEGLAPKDVLKIVKGVHFLRFGHQETFFSQDDRGKEIFFLLSGYADVFVTTKNKDGAEVRGHVGRVEAGSVLGEMAFIADKPRSATCVAVAPNTTALRFEINGEIMDEQNALLFLQIYINISHSLAEKLASANMSLLKAR